MKKRGRPKMKEEDRKCEPFSIRMSKENFNLLDNFCKKNKISRSEILEKSFDFYKKCLEFTKGE